MVTISGLAGLMAQLSEYQPWPAAQLRLGCASVAAQFLPPSILLYTIGTWLLALTGKAYRVLPLTHISVRLLKLGYGVMGAVQVLLVTVAGSVV